jgi:hypothetical protein
VLEPQIREPFTLRDILPLKISFGLRNHPPQNTGGQEGYFEVLGWEA